MREKSNYAHATPSVSVIHKLPYSKKRVQAHSCSGIYGSCGCMVTTVLPVLLIVAYAMSIPPTSFSVMFCYLEVLVALQVYLKLCLESPVLVYDGEITHSSLFLSPTFTSDVEKNFNTVHLELFTCGVYVSY